ncbi:hypothetical protein AX766_06335 [Flavobacterium covae]|nr:hypothetical protein AWN65_13510 [Flavobacterium covae]OWP79050.1 hypothetical protein BWG23_00485 [Flavobacterium oreochromis]AMA50410.1 hypothetical protein AWN65_13545 [Flavobacterium covae]AMA50416.1 hypothetical protein AWN65_13580 [Flavobacterium covae]AMA50422.1 hypothetical protein AWN65_13615 [Flavobacterium covae]
MGRFEPWQAVVFLVGESKRVKKGFFVCEGLGKQKAFFYWHCRGGKNNGCEGGEKTAGALGSVGRAGENTWCEAHRFLYKNNQLK